MALVPSRQFYTTSFFDSFQSTLFKFHGTNILFFRYAPSVSFRKLSSCSAPERDPVRKSNFASINQPNSKSIPKDSLSRSSWIDKWKISSKLSQPKPPRDAFDYGDSESGNMRSSSYVNRDSSGGSTMEKIVKKLKKYGYVEDEYGGKEEKPERVIEKGSVEDIFYIEEGMLPNTRGGFSAESPFWVENVFGADNEVRFPWEKTKEKGKVEEGSVRRKTKSLAELTLPESECRRLRNLTFKKKHKTRIGGGGVTQAVVDMIHEKWKTTELVRLKIDGVPGLNMKRMHEILERKTGGLVIWRSGTSLSLYRGVSYKVPKIQLNKRVYNRDNISSTLPAVVDESSKDCSELASDSNVDMPTEKSESSSSHEKKSIENKPEVKYEDEIDELLDTLGPRYVDWSGCDPLPVDANRLQAIVPGYQPPFRILPYGVRASLGSKEATALKRLARVLPPHFALGRSRQLQGLALAITKLWEKSSVAIIALKRGVQLTTSERMAEEIKKLTGGILLYRNKDFLVFYRGKNFLSRDVTEALLEREKLADTLQDEEEQARLRASAMVVPRNEMAEQSGTAGTLGETLDADAKWGKRLDIHRKKKVMQEAARMRHAKLVHKLENKLAFAERKMMKAEHALAKVEESLTPAELQPDPTSITDEERFMFRKLGLRMKAFLLLGRRGVFDGTVENMHLHWKYRELVKIMVNAKTFEQVKKIALALEAESGGVLVSVDKVSKKFAIIMYRGKDYQRPSTLRPKNLLTKRKALARSIELQRQEALLKHISALQSRVEKLRSELEQMDIDQGDETLYDILDSSYPSEDESEEEVDDAHLDIYDNENENSVYSINKGVGAFYDKLVSYSTEDEESEDEGAEGYTKMYGSQNDDRDERDYSNQSLHLESSSNCQDLNSEFPEKQNLLGVPNDSWLKAPKQ